MLILIGSTNPVKINSVKNAFEKYFNNVSVNGINVKSGVPEQPIGMDTYKGAENRAKSLFEINNSKKLNAEFVVGIEGGIIKQFNKWFAFGCMCIIDKEHKTSFGTSPHFELPEAVAEELVKGRELGDIIDVLTDRKNSKQFGGAIGYFSKGIMDRESLYLQGMIAAIVPFLNKDLYF